MKARIRFVAEPSSRDSIKLRELAEIIESDCGLSVEIEKGNVEQGIKDGGLIIGIAIAGLAVTSIGTLFGVLSYWKSHNPQYSISVTCGNITETIENLEYDQYLKVFDDLREARPGLADIDVQISRE